MKVPMLSSRLRLVGTMALWLTSCGRGGYDAVGVFDGDSGISPTVDGSVLEEPSLLQLTCSTDGTTELTLPTEVSIAAGAAILVRVQARTSSEAPSSVSDTQGNTYVRDFTAVEAGLSNSRVDLYSAQIDTALQPGDTITVIHADVRSNGVAVTMLPSNIAPTAVSSVVVVGESDLVQGLATVPVARGYIVAAVSGSNNLSEAHAPGWMPMPTLRPECGGAPGSSITFGDLLQGDLQATEEYQVMLSNKRIWSLGLAVYAER